MSKGCGNEEAALRGGLNPWYSAHTMLLGFIVGLVAEWLRRGLQILAPRFDSGRGLQQFIRGGDPPKSRA